MDKIYDEYYYKIFYWAIKKTNNKDDAEDLRDFSKIKVTLNLDDIVKKINNFRNI